MDTKDLYKVLEVSKGASQDEIRRSYRRLARKYHPDANPGDDKAEERFKGIQQAYEVLSNPEKRREYDEGPKQFFGAGTAGRGAGGSTGGSTGADFQNFSDLSDLFGGFGNLGDVFGQATSARRQTSPKGEDATVTVKLKFKDALEGVTTRVGVPVEEACGDCGGAGCTGNLAADLPAVRGRGTQSRDQGCSRSRPLARVAGERQHRGDALPQVSGVGKTRGVKQVKVRIPAGARDGMKVRIPGRAAPGGTAGPLGTCSWSQGSRSTRYSRGRGTTSSSRFRSVSLRRRSGGDRGSPARGGTVRLRIPPGTQNGKQFKVRGAGAPRTRKSGPERGDLIVRVGVVVPKKLKRREREILEALAEERDENVRAELFRRVGS
nr:J domain-containing protein [Rubrobacter tropicus]